MDSTWCARWEADLIDTVWAIIKSESGNKHSEKSRLENLEEAKLKPCDTDAELGIQCNESWLARALETLRHNNIDRNEFSNLVQHKYEYRRAKSKYIMICGLTNCTKSLKPKWILHLRVFDCCKPDLTVSSRLFMFSFLLAELIRIMESVTDLQV